MISLPAILFAAIVGVVAFSANKAIELMLTNEYRSWSSSLARFLVSCAGLVCPAYRERWSADLLYEQQEEGRSGLGLACDCLIGAPNLTIRAAVTSRRFLRRRKAPVVLITAADSANATDAAVVVALSAHIGGVGGSSGTLTVTRSQSRLVGPGRATRPAPADPALDGEAPDPSQ